MFVDAFNIMLLSINSIVLFLFLLYYPFYFHKFQHDNTGKLFLLNDKNSTSHLSPLLVGKEQMIIPCRYGVFHKSHFMDNIMREKQRFVDFSLMLMKIYINNPNLMKIQKSTE